MPKQKLLLGKLAAAFVFACKYLQNLRHAHRGMFIFQVIGRDLHGKGHNSFLSIAFILGSQHKMQKTTLPKEGNLLINSANNFLFSSLLLDVSHEDLCF